MKRLVAEMFSVTLLLGLVTVSGVAQKDRRAHSGDEMSRKSISLKDRGEQVSKLEIPVARGKSGEGFAKAMNPKFAVPRIPSFASSTSVGGELPKLCGSVVFSDNIYLSRGLYNLPLASGEIFQTIIKGPAANYGGVYKDGIYYATNYKNNMSDVNTTITGYDLSTGMVVYSYSEDTTVGPLIAMGLALDPITDEIYGIVYNEEVSGQMLAKIVYNKTPEWTKIADLPETWNTFMIDSDGQFYGIRKDYQFIEDGTYLVGSTLCKIDRNNGAVTEVGTTGKFPVYLSGGCIDPTSGRMFWAVSDQESGYICEVDKATGEASIIYTFPDGEEVCGMYAPVPAAVAAAPGAVANLTAEFNEGSLTGEIKCDAPSALFNGESATGKVTLHVLANGKEVASTETTYGASVTIPVTLQVSGYYNFLVYAENAAGKGPKERVDDRYIGFDTPVATTVTLKEDNGKMMVSWLKVTETVNGGYMNPEDVTYTVTRYPDNVVVAKNIKETEFEETLETPEKQTAYSYGVRAEYEGMVSAEAVSNAISLGTIVPPYKADFSSPTGFTGYTIIDANNDGYTWEQNLSYGYARIRWNSTMDMDDWLITPPVMLKAGESYEVSFPAYSSSRVNTERLEVKWGKAPTVEGMTTTIVEPTDIENSLTEPEITISAYISPEEDGLYYIGVHGISPKDKSALWVGDISISAPMRSALPGTVTDLAVTPDPSGALIGKLSFKAPTVTMGEKPLTEITKIEVLNREEKVVHTFENPEPGAELSCEVAEEKAGTYEYSVVCYNSIGAGVAATIASYIGLDKPAVPANLVMSATQNVGEVSLVWDVVSTDQNGNPINSDLVTYTVFRIKGGEQVEIASDLKTTSYTYQAVEPGTQEFVQCAVFAKTEGGYGSGALTTMLPIGTPYAGLTESFADGQIHYIWGVGSEGNASWGLFTDRNTLSSQDSDNGFMGLTGYANGDTGRIFSGLVSLKGMENPGFTFYTFNLTGEAGTPDENIIRVSIREEGQEYEEVLAGTIEELTDGNSGWNKIIIDLKGYADKVIQVSLEGETVNFAYVLIDNLRIASLLNYDMNALDISAPGSVATGETYKVNVTAQNVGISKADKAFIDLYENGALVETKTVEDVLPEARIMVSFERTMSPIAEEAVSYYAVIRYELDEYQDNNRTATVTVSPRPSKLPVVSDLSGKCGDGNVTLTWSEPELIQSGVPVTDDFEDGDAFASEYGNWIFADEDKAAVGGFEETEMPGIEPGATKGSFWIWDQSQVGNGSFAAHSGYKYLFALYRADSGQSDDWAISPALDGREQTVSFYARSYHDGYPETIEVYYSTGGTEVKDFIKVPDVGGVVPEEWTLYEVKLPQGAKRFAIRSCASDSFMLLIDDVTYIPEVKDDYTIEGYNVYRDGVKINKELLEENEYVDSDVKEETTYSYVVTAVYSEGESSGSNVVTILYQTNGVSELSSEITKITVRNHAVEVSNPTGEVIIITSCDGKVLYTSSEEGNTSVELETGIYIVKVGSVSKTVFVK
ncbi:MAG: choice-of-anchor J domain-containing protein [Muribaculaceae bacterium]|nr:choice-of-anchor J domain-containing protein [Muribaculaceae bacterium]